MITKNVELKKKWRTVLMSHGGTDKKTKLERVQLRSLNGVMVKAGSLYTFENSIVICCLDSCMDLTFNLLVTFK